MGDRPDGAELLRQARRGLLDELLGALPEDKRYPALMVASAMAIALRELEAGEQRDAQRLALEAILGPGQGEDLDGILLSLRRRLAEEIRAGKRDAAPALHALLEKDARARLAISNPKLLPGDKTA